MKLFFYKPLNYLSKNWFWQIVCTPISLLIMICVTWCGNTALAQETYHFHFTHQYKSSDVDLDQFIKFVASVEQRYITDKAQPNQSLMITRLRKLYYNNAGFDKYLIKGTSSVQPLAVKQKELYPAEVLHTPYETIDMGHVLCGIDAHNHLHKVTPPKILGINILPLKIQCNTDAITWIGDLGSLVAEVYLKQKQIKRKLTDTELQVAIDSLSGVADNVGNIDGVLLGSVFATFPERSVAALLHQFYRQDTTTMLRNRFLLFAEKIGLVWNGQGFENKVSIVNKYAKQVNDAAAMYFAQEVYKGNKKQLVLHLPRLLRISHSKIAYYIVARFFDDIERAIRVREGENTKLRNRKM